MPMVMAWRLPKLNGWRDQIGLRRQGGSNDVTVIRIARYWSRAFRPFLLHGSLKSECNALILLTQQEREI